MQPRPLNRQDPPPSGRVVPFSVKLTTEESAALLLVGRKHGKDPRDLLRERGLNELVKEYHKLTEKVAAAG